MNFILRLFSKIAVCMLVYFSAHTSSQAQSQNAKAQTPSREIHTPAVFVVELKNGQGLDKGNSTKKTRITAPSVRSILQSFNINDNDVEAVIPEHLNTGSTVVHHPYGWVYAVPNYGNMVRITVKKAESKKEFVAALKKLPEISGIEEVLPIKDR